MAAATIVPGGTRTSRPFTVSRISDMLFLLKAARRQVGFSGNCRGTTEHQGGEQMGCGGRGSNAQALVSGRQPEVRAFSMRTDQGQTIGRGGAKAGPAADAG